ncbi:agmatine deiminase family protein [Streptomyces sp. NPDC058741]|uniref:agmatine deiminase family protein n=1 Tax=unclassified Streptomyces TaxID=2593676 RepID=UPI0036ADC569
MLTRAFEQQTGLPFTPPPDDVYQNHRPSPVRAVPEFAPMGGVLIACPGVVAQPSDHIQLPPTKPRSFGIPDELIIRMQQIGTGRPVEIFVLCDDPEELATLRGRLARSARQFDLPFAPERLHLVPWDTDTYWTRDYAPWWVKNETTGHFGVAKHIYTSLGGGAVGLVEGAEHVTPRQGLGIFRPNDDAGAAKFSDYLNAPIRSWDAARWHSKRLEQIPPHNWYCTGLLEVGGNYMVTGDGVIASSYLVATQNELPVARRDQTMHPSQDVIAQRMEYILEQFNRFMGIHTYLVFADPTGTYIGHIDCWGKFLARRKVLIAKSQDPRVAEKLDAIASRFAGEGFEVTRVMCQNVYIPGAETPATTAAYVNSLILNDHVYVPLAGSPHEKHDEAALAAYGEALPEHSVVGIQPRPETPWLGTDALHCRTHGVPREVVDDWLRSQVPC